FASAFSSPLPLPLAWRSDFSLRSAFSGLASAPAAASAFLPFFLGFSSSAIDRLVVAHAPARLLPVHDAERHARLLALVDQRHVQEARRSCLVSDPARTHGRGGLLVLLHDVEPLDHDAVTLAVDAQHVAAL